LSVYNHFQWYYFDLHSVDGFDLICTMHVVPFNSAFNISIVDIYLYRGEKTELHHYFVLPQRHIKFQDDPFLLQMDAHNFISKKDNNIYLQARDTKTDLRIELQNNASDSEPPVVSLLPPDYPEDGFYWKVFAPSCNGKAWLLYDGRRFELQGPAYHDFNGGRLNLKQELKYWYWGKYSFDDRLFIYGEITTRKKETKRVALLSAEGHVQLDENPLRTVKDGNVYYSTHMGDFGFKMGERRQIDAISFFMSTLSSAFITKLIEIVYQLSAKLPFLSKLHQYMGNARYLRFRANGETLDGVPVKTFFEEMFL